MSGEGFNLPELLSRLPSYQRESEGEVWGPCPFCSATVRLVPGTQPWCEGGCDSARVRDELERLVGARSIGVRPCPDAYRFEHQRGWDGYCPACEDYKAWTRLLREDRLREMYQAHRDQQRQRALLDGTALLEAQALLPFEAASLVAKREVPPDSLPGLLSQTGTATEWTGYRGSMKSLTALTVSAAIAEGQPEVFGLPLRLAGPVLYLAREGQPGWPRRLRAWEAFHERTAPDALLVEHEAFDITKDDDLAALVTLVHHHRAAMVVLDPVAMTGGGQEDQENYTEVRQGALDLASNLRHPVLVLLLTNSGYAVRTRGRGSSTLVDGMDLSVSLVSDEHSGLVTVSPNKNRESAQVERLVLRFEGAGEVDPDDSRRFLSGVVVTVSEREQRRIRRAANDKAREAALGVVAPVLRERCVCPPGSSGTRRYPGGCPSGGATTEEMAHALGLPDGAEERRQWSRDVRAYLKPLTGDGTLRSTGHTKGLRWHWGNSLEVSFADEDEDER